MTENKITKALEIGLETYSLISNILATTSSFKSLLVAVGQPKVRKCCLRSVVFENKLSTQIICSKNKIIKKRKKNTTFEIFNGLYTSNVCV